MRNKIGRQIHTVVVCVCLACLAQAVHAKGGGKFAAETLNLGYGAKPRAMAGAYGAIAVTDHETRRGVERYAEVTGALCKGCGTCASSCRCGAVDVQGFTNEQILAAVLAS